MYPREFITRVTARPRGISLRSRILKAEIPARIRARARAPTMQINYRETGTEAGRSEAGDMRGIIAGGKLSRVQLRVHSHVTFPRASNRTGARVTRAGNR